MSIKRYGDDWILPNTKDGDYVLYTDHIAALEAVKATVKPLEWQDASDGLACHRAAPSVGPVYWVEDDGFSEKKYHVRAHHLVLGNVDTLDDAKAIAQADYEQRILSALDFGCGIDRSKERQDV